MNNSKCSMSKKKESLTKKSEGLSEYRHYTNPDNGRTASLDPIKHPGLNKFIVYFGTGEKRYSSIKDAEDDLKSRGYEKDESKKSEANIDDLKGMVVSEGTMGVNVLIRKYLDVLETYAPDNYKVYIEANPELKDRDVWMALDVRDKSYIVDELADELDKIAPEGYYFGASEGDGACYGFWEVEPDESKKSEACKGGKDDDTKVGKDGKATESKKSEGIDGAIKMNIDYNTFMRLLDAAAYLDADDDYKDALWDYYSEFGEIDGDADVFFDNLFQYTAWYDVDEMYDAIGERFQDESKSKEECIQDAIDDVDMTICPYNDHYLVIF